MQNVSRCEWNPPRAGSAPPRSQVRAPCVPHAGAPRRGPGAPLRAEMSAGLRGGDGLSAARLAAVSLG